MVKLVNLRDGLSNAEMLLALLKELAACPPSPQFHEARVWLAEQLFSPSARFLDDDKVCRSVLFAVCVRV